MLDSLAVRAIWLLLTCLMLPLQGLAAAHVFDRPCPMVQGAAQAGVDVAAQAGECCNDPQAAASTGQSCNTSQQCQGNAFHAAAPVGARTVTGASGKPVPAIRPLARSILPTPVWRPPALS